MSRVHTENELLKFLKPYKRIFSSTVCTQTVDQSDVTFWVYDKSSWLKHDGKVPKGHPSWCHAFFKTVLGLSQTEYDKVKKRLFSGEGLTGVYKSGNSYAIVFRPSTTLSRAHIAAILAGSLVAGGVGLAAKTKFQQKPTAVADKVPEPQSDIERLNELFKEFLTKIQSNENIDQTKITEYLRIYLYHVNDQSFVQMFESDRDIVNDVINAFDPQNLRAVLEKTNAEIVASPMFANLNYDDWQTLADVYQIKFGDLESADKIRAAMYFQMHIANYENAIKDLVRMSLESDHANSYNKALTELINVSKDSDVPVSQLYVDELKWDLLWNSLALDVINDQEIDESKLDEFKKISEHLSSTDPKSGEVTRYAPDLLRLFLSNDFTLSHIDKIIDDNSFEDVVKNPRLAPLWPTSLAALPLLYYTSVSNGNNDEARQQKANAARLYYMVQTAIDKNQLNTSDPNFVEFIRSAVLDELQGYDAYNEALHELIEKYGEDFERQVNASKQIQLEDIQADLDPLEY